MRKRWLGATALAAVLLAACSDEKVVEEQEIEILPVDEYIAEFKQSENYEKFIGDSEPTFIQAVDFTKDDIPELVTSYEAEVEGKDYTYVSVFSRAEKEGEVTWNLATEMYSEDPEHSYNNYGTFRQEDFVDLWIGGYTEGAGDDAKQVVQVYDLVGGKLTPLETIEGVATEEVVFDNDAQELQYHGEVTYTTRYVDGELIVDEK